MPSHDTVYVVSMDTVVLIKENIEAYSRTLSSIETIGTWVGITAGLLAIMITVAIAVFGIKTFSDRAAISKEIKQAEIRTRQEIEAATARNLENASRNLKQNLLSIWVRQILDTKSEILNLAVYRHALKLAVELQDTDKIFVFLFDLHRFALEHPDEIGTDHWDDNLKDAMNELKSLIDDVPPNSPESITVQSIRESLDRLAALRHNKTGKPPLW
jgi:hypothetical protein